jgi:serralysin
MPGVSTFGLTGNPYLDGMLTGTKWAVNALTFSFPTDASFYGSYGSETTTNFGAFSSVQRAP